MSAVLLSTMAGERLTPRKTAPQRSKEILPLLKRTGTCRNLFGPVDHDKLRRELSSKLRKISERDQLRWNFNFSEGQPLDGDLKWEESRAEECPQFYRETTAVSKSPFVNLSTTERITQVGPKRDGRSVKVLNQKKQINKCNRRKLSRKPVARVQTKRLTDMRITDFYGKRKKTENVHKESGNME
ncbi:Cyclin-dependent kinase inhibitor 1C [Labeo rohita]|uniref:Cyclin-dependent kinase inhibitor 1C n=1 Tax=Labeo rohita TaxID=84645 RepID=A0ABQ8LFM0_LABRO|nr:cyclin-dependent kinase inhibitor 1C [Labeo rohita]KAI2648536.1 Cyclin-dependent kinase inhibitor 1C [Labeo rohita]